MNRFWRWAYLIAALGLMTGWFWFAAIHAQDPDQPAEHHTADGANCQHQTLKWDVAPGHVCECMRRCYWDEQEPPGMHAQEDPQCQWYCKPNHCDCGPVCEDETSPEGGR